MYLSFVWQSLNVMYFLFLSPGTGFLTLPIFFWFQFWFGEDSFWSPLCLWLFYISHLPQCYLCGFSIYHTCPSVLRSLCFIGISKTHTALLKQLINSTCWFEQCHLLPYADQIGGRSLKSPHHIYPKSLALGVLLAMRRECYDLGKICPKKTTFLLRQAVRLLQRKTSTILTGRGGR